MTIIQTPDAEKDKFLQQCDGSPGVKIKLVDNNKLNLSYIPNSVVGIVGFSSNGPFNKIIKISSSTQIDKILGNGFNNPAYNQGLYAARAILNNGGFVEFVRPYGEPVDLNSQTDRELKSDAYVFRYNYNYSLPYKNNAYLDFFSATRHVTDGYSTFGKREIFTSEKAIVEGKCFDFTLNKSEIVASGINEIALFSIIDEDPTTCISASSELDNTADKVTVSFASYKLARNVSDFIQFTSQPSLGDKFSTIDENGIVKDFTFISGITSGLNIQIGTSLSITLDNIKLSLINNMPNHTVTRLDNKITISIYFGTKDLYNQLTQSIIFTELIDIGSVFSVGIATVVEDAYLIDSTLGKKFLDLGLSDEVFVKEYFGGNLLKKYLLNSDGMTISRLYLMVDYKFGNNVYSFSGTIIPYNYNAIDLYIKTHADSVSNNFQFLVNDHVDLLTASSNINFNLANIKTVFEAKVATTTNIILTGTQTIDGISLISGDYVLVKDQINETENGVYTVSTGSWYRTSGVNANSDINTNLFVLVKLGTLFTNTTWKVSTVGSDVILGSTPMTFYQDSNQPVIGFMSKVSFDENDPAYINLAEWQYIPSAQLSSNMMSAAWQLFLDKGKSNADFLLSAGTGIKNLFYKNAEELDYIVIESMLNVCELRKDMFCIFDGLDELNIDKAVQKMIGVGSFGDKGRWGAIFDGRSIFNDKIYTKLEVPVVKSIEVGAIISNNRRGGIYWIPPAGRDFGTIPRSLADRQTYIRRFNSADDVSSDVSKLYAACINPTRLLKSTPVLYGQKTMLKKDNDLNRLNVTMLIAGLHKRLSNFLDNKMLKLNTYSFRISVKEELRNLLNRIKSSNPSGLISFDIRCDDTNNTRETICQNKLIIDIELNPTKSIECIILRTTVQRTEKDLILADFQLKIR